jgi:hypothetical protein
MQRDGRPAEEWAKAARRRVGRLTVALRRAQARGEVATACQPEAVAHFLVASLEGAVLVSRVMQDPTVMQHCVGELNRYLGALRGSVGSPFSAIPDWQARC